MGSSLLSVLFYHVEHFRGRRHQQDLVDKALLLADMECLPGDLRQTDTAAQDPEEVDLVAIDEEPKRIPTRQDPTTLAHNHRRGEDEDPARTRDHRQEGHLEDELQRQEVHRGEDAEAPATALGAATVAAEVAAEVGQGVNLEAEAGIEVRDEWRHDESD